MIGKITGRLDHCGLDYAMVEAGGVGYVLHCSERTLRALPEAGSFVALYTELVVREDLMQLFGFLTPAEKEWHRLLTSVQGIGAKVAMAILGTLGPDGVGRAISLGDVAAVKAAPGVGPKTAQRVILELKDKAPAVMALGAKGAAPATAAGVPAAPAAGPQAPQDAVVASPPVADAGIQADALSALVNLGYAPGEAAAAVATVAAEDGAEVSAVIRDALRLLAPKG
ncbi:Holliday junction branch migration protein RuvA [Algicella marina]|uniref:Holliday junction branch migration complex subunit RuvA n=1 Tax=Algicella marina TaxID=2683284 RepID=A0A6P1T593_9RHOB|nr:Holliday junction branch migration protein RuvA [Algicella marina]QHQ37207.1 Holliday junction branch migration protein RuvA [Algicella marina]